MERVSLAEAARRLGLSTVATRKRAQRGTLAAEKVDGEWTILLPSETASGQVGSPPHANGHTGQVRPDVGSPPMDAPLVVELRGRVAFLEEELTARRHEVERLHTLLAQAQARPALAAETSGASIRPTPAARSEPAPRRWWQWWRA